ncbi:acyl carrier protein [bacterium]|jgi:acyl carrier protein|nr:acyl carrier protein [bacterium]
MINIEKLHRVISDVLGVPVEHISDESSPDNIDKWDSLTHINLIIAIESEFNISLTPEDTMDMLSVKLIRIILESKVE